MTLKKLIATLDRVDDFPTLPSVFVKVSKLLRDPRSTAEQIARVIESDQAITSKVLRLVNSSFFGFSRKIYSVKQAVVLLGFNAIRNAVLSVSVMDSFPRRGGSEYFNWYQFWKHSIGTGIIARFMEKQLEAGDEEEAFTAGILHDLGKLLLDMFFHDAFTEALKASHQKNLPLFKAEKEVFGVSHDEIGEYLADKWNLPYGLTESMAFHHIPSIIRSNPKLVSIIHLADIICRRLKIGSGGGDFIPEIEPFVLEELEMDENTLERWTPQIEEELEKAKDLFLILNIEDVKKE